MSSSYNYINHNASYDWCNPIVPIMLNEIADDSHVPEVPGDEETPSTSHSIALSPITNHTNSRPHFSETSLSHIDEEFFSFASSLYIPPPTNSQTTSPHGDENSSSSSSTPSSSSDEPLPLANLASKRKRARPLISKALTKTHYHYTEVSYAVALHLLFLNNILMLKPKNITTDHWKFLTTLAEQNKLVEVVSRAPFVLKIDSKLDFVHYTLARFGRGLAMERIDPYNHTFEERRRWWSASNLFGPIETSTQFNQMSEQGWIYRTIELPQSIKDLTRDRSNVETLSIISKILNRALQLALSSNELKGTFDYGVEYRDITIRCTLSHAIEQSTQHPQHNDALHPAPLLLPESSTKHPKGHDLRFNTLSKYLALNLLFSARLPDLKPTYILNPQIWDDLKQKQTSSTLIFSIKRTDSILSFSTPYLYGEYCRKVALEGENNAVSFRPIDNKFTYYRWWSYTKKNMHPFQVNSSTIRSAEKDPFKATLVHKITLPNEFAVNLNFNALTVEEQLKVIQKFFQRILTNALPAIPYERLLVEGVPEKTKYDSTHAFRFPVIYHSCLAETMAELGRLQP